MSDFDRNLFEDKKLPPEKPINQPIISTEKLFAGFREITIEHAGEIYRLRITRRNKLILQK